MNSIPQQDVANGKGHKEFLRAKPTTSSNFVAKKPGPSSPSGLLAISSLVRFMISFAILSIFDLMNC
jgi:hypothetical protein